LQAVGHSWRPGPKWRSSTRSVSRHRRWPLGSCARPAGAMARAL
jgi:hypothetical protein